MQTYIGTPASRVYGRVKVTGEALRRQEGGWPFDGQGRHMVQTSRFGSVIFSTRGSSALPHTGQNLYGGVSSWECMKPQYRIHSCRF